MMCALVANANHSVQPDSGNCDPLPDVPVAIALQDIPCQAGIDARIGCHWRSCKPWQARLVLGISPGRILVECGDSGQAG